MPKQHIKIALAAALILGLAGCNSVKKELGVGRNSPDEFTVIKRAPLTIPPDYALRPPPGPGETVEAGAMPQPTETAKETVIGKTAPAAANAGDRTMLEKLGAAEASPDIRRKIDEDNGYLSLENRTVAQKLIFWDDEQKTSPENIPSSIVDPKAEAARIKKNQEEGKPVTEGTVPVIEKKKTTIDKIF